MPKEKNWIRRSSGEIAAGFDRILLHEFDFLERHRDFVNTHFANSTEAFTKNFDEEIALVKDEAQKAAYADYMNDEYIAIAEILPRLQWNAQFLVVYSSFEHALNRLCAIVKNRSGFELSFKDLAGNGIVRASSYLRKVASVEGPFQTSHWNRALLLGDIRNAIAHKNGEIEYTLHSKNSLAFRAKSLPGIELIQLIKDDPNATIFINSTFVKDAICSLRLVLSDVANYKLY